jgi:hypothetical protein
MRSPLAMGLVTIVAMLASPAVAEDKWIDAGGADCAQVCRNENLYPVFAGSGGVTRGTSWICSGRTRGYRGGRTLEGGAGCNVPGGSTRFTMNYYCLCLEKELPRDGGPN